MAGMERASVQSIAIADFLMAFLLWFESFRWHDPKFVPQAFILSLLDRCFTRAHEVARFLLGCECAHEVVLAREGIAAHHLPFPTRSGHHGPLASDSLRPISFWTRLRRAEAG